MKWMRLHPTSSSPLQMCLTSCSPRAFRSRPLSCWQPMEQQSQHFPIRPCWSPQWMKKPAFFTPVGTISPTWICCRPGQGTPPRLKGFSLIWRQRGCWWLTVGILSTMVPISRRLWLPYLAYIYIIPPLSWSTCALWTGGCRGTRGDLPLSPPSVLVTCWYDGQPFKVFSNSPCMWISM